MYFAKNTYLENFEIYLSFLLDIIEKDNSRYKETFSSIIKYVHLLSNRKIDFTEVPKEIFDIVSLLSFHHLDYFKKINPENITLDNYKQISSFLTQDLKQLS